MIANRRSPADEPHDPFGDVDPGVVTDCSAIIARLDYFLDGELTELRRIKIEAHLDGCPTCYSAFDFEAELRVVVRTRTVTEVPPELVARIRAALNAVH
jgi:anti-sigma factor (TIGR02949 family)